MRMTVRICSLAALAVALCGCGQKKSGEREPGGARQVPTIPLEEATAGTGVERELTRAREGQLGGYPRFPDVHGDAVVFTAEEDLWLASLKGGVARRLTVHAGMEFFAKFSPDGKWIAFSGDYDGNEDVFVMPSAGGLPRRVTYHPSPDQVLGWTPDGASIVFRSMRHHAHRQWTLHTIGRDGGDPVRLPLARGARIAHEPGGERVAINRISRDFRRWKRYAGGKATKIFVGDLQGGAFKKLTTFSGTNACPMWHGGRIYFLSNRTGTQNLWSTTPAGEDLRQHTRFDDYDVRFPSLGGGTIVFQHRAELHQLKLASGKVAKIPLVLLSDRLRARARFTDPLTYLTRYEISPDGRHLALEVRGDLHLVPAAKEGLKVRLTADSGVRSWGLSFGPRGERLAAVSDATGEAEVFVYDREVATAPRQITRDGECHKFPPRWSPDGARIAYSDSRNRLFIVDAAGRQSPREVDRSPHGRIRGYTWSPDGRYLAYVKREPNYWSSIFIRDTRRNRTIRVTDAYFDEWSPTWSADGKYLAFLSDRTVNPYLDRLDFETILVKATKPYLVLLSAKTRSPFVPAASPPDDEKNKDDDGTPGAGRAAAARKAVELDAEGIGRRIVEVPVEAGHYSALHAGDGFLLYIDSESQGMAEWGRFPEMKPPHRRLVRFDIEDKKARTFFDRVTSYAVSRDGKRIAVLRKKNKKKLYAFDLGKKAPEDDALDEARIPLGTIREAVDPRAEWRQIFDEVWRMMRDLYWTPDMGRVDWKAMRDKYRPLLSRIATRRELNDLLGELVAELSLGHTYIWGGDRRQPGRVPVGLLGADIAPHESGRYQFKRIYRGANWDADRRSPLTLPHVKVEEGDFLLRVDGRPVKPGDNVYSRLQKAAGEMVQLTVAPRANPRKTRDVEVTTLKSETEIRYYSWVARNREQVDEKTEGRVGYLHIPDMMTRGMVEFDRWYYPQVRKQGLIVDARWNRGGFVSQLLIKRLTRKVLAWSTSRTGWVGPYPANTLHGHVVVLTNESAGSDGDIFPRAVQVAGIGPVIGTRTWGGVVGINLANPLVDKGVSTRPRTFAWWEPERRWSLEGEGVVPDIVVDNDPAAMDRGTDRQLERAITEILARLKKTPVKPPAFGATPDKTKKTWVDRYGQTDRP